MTDFVYRITDSCDDEYWETDATCILTSYGTAIEVMRFSLADPVDVTDSINGEYHLDT